MCNIIFLTKNDLGNFSLGKDATTNKLKIESGLGRLDLIFGFTATEVQADEHKKMLVGQPENNLRFTNCDILSDIIKDPKKQFASGTESGGLLVWQIRK